MSGSRWAAALLGLDAWLETMRGPQGYGGPVAHWWRDCLLYTGAGLDWRYEGIVLGYLSLYRKTGEAAWLAKARRAGDDLVRGQLADGRFRNSNFELNPAPGGTPHEAACDLALVRLAEALRGEGEPGWQAYLAAAERNLRGTYLGVLWDGKAGRFWDDPRQRSFVPNKAATLAEALLAWAEVTGDGEPTAYALPALWAILEHQVQDGRLEGAIDQYSRGGRRSGRYFPYYIARCVPGLVAGWRWSTEERLLEAALRAMRFVVGRQAEDGTFPQVVYAGGRANRYPQWIAAAGDILRAMEMLRPYGLEADLTATQGWLLAGQEATGGFRTARGFASQATQRAPGPVPEFRDLLGAVGWSDKAFRYLAERLPEAEAAGLVPREGAVAGWEAECEWRGERLRYREDGEAIELRRGGEVRYRWRKGAAWAEAGPEFWAG